MLRERRRAAPPEHGTSRLAVRAGGQLRLVRRRARPGDLRFLLRRGEDTAVATARQAEALPLAHAKLCAALGAALLDAGNPAAARAELQAARALFESLQPQRSADHADVLIDLARAQLALGQAHAARALTEEAVSFWARFDPDHRSADVARLWHARSRLPAGHPVAAADVLRPASPGRTVSARPADRALLDSARRDVDPQRLTQH